MCLCSDGGEIILSKAGVRSSLQAKRSVHRTINAVSKFSAQCLNETGKVKIRERWIKTLILIALFGSERILVLIDKEAFKSTFK